VAFMPGKGSLARLLAEYVASTKKSVAVLSQDRFFKFEGETPESIDWRRLMKELLVRFLKRKDTFFLTI
jgi:uridine kinase